METKILEKCLVFPLVGLVRVMDIVVNEEPKITIHHFLKFFFLTLFCSFSSFFLKKKKKWMQVLFVSHKQKSRYEKKIKKRRDK
jgi:hypothetical protein